MSGNLPTPLPVPPSGPPQSESCGLSRSPSPSLLDDLVSAISVRAEIGSAVAAIHSELDTLADAVRASLTGIDAELAEYRQAYSDMQVEPALLREVQAIDRRCEVFCLDMADRQNMFAGNLDAFLETSNASDELIAGMCVTVQAMIETERQRREEMDAFREWARRYVEPILTSPVIVQHFLDRDERIVNPPAGPIPPVLPDLEQLRKNVVRNTVEYHGRPRTQQRLNSLPVGLPSRPAFRSDPPGPTALVNRLQNRAHVGPSNSNPPSGPPENAPLGPRKWLVSHRTYERQSWKRPRTD